MSGASSFLPPVHRRCQLFRSPRGGGGGGGGNYDNGSFCKVAGEVEEEESYGRWWSADVYSSDEFRMYEFKVRRCMRISSHDWTDCPFAHPGEKARRRDPRRYGYSGTVCRSFRSDGHCGRGDACEFSHGVFECWLHPSRYRTMPCKDGQSCRRKVCFFAHTPDQLRPATVTASSRRMRCIFLPKPLAGGGSLSSSPTSTLSGFPCGPSPPPSPTCGDVRVTARNHGLQTTPLEMYYSTCAELVRSIEAMDLGSAATPGLLRPSSADSAVASPAPQEEEDRPDLDWVIELVM